MVLTNKNTLRSKATMVLLLLLCFVFMGCPPGHFYEYEYVGTPLPHDGLAYNRIGFNEETDLHVKVGYYNEFIEEKETGLAAIIKLRPSFDLRQDAVVAKVESTIFGELHPKDSLPYTTRVYDKANTLMYNLSLKEQNERKMLHQVKDDTISIELTNGKTLLFVRKTP